MPHPSDEPPGADLLWETYWDGRSIPSRNSLAISYMGLVDKAVRCCVSKLPSYISRASAHSAAADALLGLIEMYTPKTGGPAFSGYAFKRLHGAILDLISQEAAWHAKHVNVEATCRSGLGVGDSEDGALEALESDAGGLPARQLDYKDVRLDGICQGLPAREVCVLYLLCRCAKSQKDVAELLDRSEGWVSTVLSEAQARIRSTRGREYRDGEL